MSFFKKDAAHSSLRKMLSTKQRGDRITAQEIIDATGFDRWQQFRRVIRRWATRNGFVAVAVPNDGYRLALAHEHLDEHEKLRTRARRAEVRGFGVLVQTPVAELDDRQLRRHQALITRSQQRLQMADKHDAELKPKALKDRPPRRFFGFVK